MKNFSSIDEILQGKQNIGISGHVRPDGDCVGSTLSVYNYIKTYYPDVNVELFLEPIPHIFEFLQGADEICFSTPKREEFDLFICLDCGDAGRMGEAAKYFDAAKTTACIDHHVSNQSFAEYNYIFPEASATCELVFELMETERITKEIAECLYTGMVHDTGVFQYSCTSAHTMEIAGILMEKGIAFTEIVDSTFYTKTYNQNRVMGQVLVDSKLYLDGKCIFGLVTLDMMKEFDVLPKHLDGIVNQLRVTKDVEVAIFVYENEDGSYKVSTRANGNVNLAELAQHFHGGGHVKAAGFTMYGTPEEFLPEILAEIEKQL